MKTKKLITCISVISTLIACKLPAQCLVSSNLTANPQPVNGTYQPGQTVNFCFTVTAWSQINTNWFHGVVPVFGSGWDMSSLVTTPALSCDGTGSWNWYNTAITSTGTGLSFGPGFFYESNVPGALDANPGNNYGDNCTGTGLNWQFCWSILVDTSAAAGADLGMSVNTTADGESGVWSNIACVNDPSINNNSPVIATAGSTVNYSNEISVLAIPSSGKIQVKQKNQFKENVTLEIFDMSGRKIYSEGIPSGQSVHEISSAGFSNGIYFIGLTNKSGRIFSAKVLVET